jgi:Protein of unknown function (DUF2794)
MNKSVAGGKGAGVSVVRYARPEENRASGSPGRRPERVSFTRSELASLLHLYGRRVSEGAWCDYAMDFLHDRAMFSIYRANSAHPIYVVEKNPKQQRKQGQYLVTSHNGRVLKRGQVLSQVLRVLEGRLALVK